MVTISTETAAAQHGAPADSFVLVRASGLVCLLRKDLASLIRLDRLAQPLLLPANSRTNGAAPATGPRFGRGRVARVDAGGISLISRPYLRGGLISRINSDTFFRIPPWSSFRMFAELRVLSALSLQGVAVPRPAGAIVHPLVQFGAFSVYRGLILTEEIPAAKNLLFSVVEARSLPQASADAPPLFSAERVCREAGRQARRSLELGVFHPDLHPGNVLYDPSGKTYLIDFDRARLSYDRPLGLEWRRRTIARWNRSVEKHLLPPICRTAFIDGLSTAG